jgi:hypothetical protein
MTTPEMKAVFVEARQVSIPFETADNVFTSALENVLGSEPPQKARAIALAKTALESGRWGAKGGLWNWNFGNIKAGPAYEGQFTAYKCNEILPGRGLVWFDPAGELESRDGPIVGRVYTVPDAHPQCRFRAYAGPTDGAYEYVDFIAGGRFNDAFAELLEGDVVGYVHALKLKGYFTADETVYRRGVEGLFKEFLKRLEGEAIFRECGVPDPLDVRACLAPQRHNAEAVAFATGVAIDSLYASLEDLRNDANAQMAIEPEEDEFPTKEPPTKSDRPKQS